MASPTPPASSTYKPAQPNPALRMLGIPSLPQKLPSRNWLIFISATAALAAAITYDRREKRRATQRWARAVSHLAAEAVPDPRALPRRLTVYLASPPGDGFRPAREHFNEYIRPILAASGLDWEFVHGRRQGDIRGAVAERIRRERRNRGELAEAAGLAAEPGASRADGADPAGPADRTDRTDEEITEAFRSKMGIRPYEGARGDIVIGRHVWKEYICGLHEGWLGPLASPPAPPPPPSDPESAEKPAARPPPPPPSPPPPQILPEHYSGATTSPLIPAELGPSSPVPLPHVLGFSATFTRLGRFFTRRLLADEIGRDVAAACLAAARPFSSPAVAATVDGAGGRDQNEVQAALVREERDWVGAVWEIPPPPPSPAADAPPSPAADAPPSPAAGAPPQPALPPPRETVWRETLTVDERVASRMRRFEITPEQEARVRTIVVPEELVEGWIKGTARSVGRWAVRKWTGDGKWTPPALADSDRV